MCWALSIHACQLVLGMHCSLQSKIYTQSYCAFLSYSGRSYWSTFSPGSLWTDPDCLVHLIQWTSAGMLGEGVWEVPGCICRSCRLFQGWEKWPARGRILQVTGFHWIRFYPLLTVSLAPYHRIHTTSFTWRVFHLSLLCRLIDCQVWFKLPCRSPPKYMP